MQTPHDPYLAHLLGLDLDDDEIVRVLEMDHLVVPNPAELARLRFKLADRPERPWDDGKAEARDWASYYCVDRLLVGGGITSDAFAILRSTVNRVPVEALLLGGMDPEAVAEFAKAHELIGVSEDAVELYEWVFWSIRRLSVAQWTEFLQRHPMGTVYLKVLAEGVQTAKVVAEAFLKRLPVEEKVAVDPERMSEFMKGATRLSGLKEHGPVAPDVPMAEAGE